MSSITINLQAEQMARLQEIAARLGISLEDLARGASRNYSLRPKKDLNKQLTMSLRRMTNLYRRLA